MNPDRTEAADPSDEERILAFLASSLAAADVEAIVAATGLRENTVRRTLGKLVKERAVRRAGGGRFARAARRGR